MNLFKKAICAMFSILLLCLPNVFAANFDFGPGGEPSEYNVSCIRRGDPEAVEITGGMGRYFIHHPNIRLYTITNTLLSQHKICDIIVRSASEYLLEFEEKSPGYWNKWRIYRPQNRSYWVLKPAERPKDRYHRKIYIRKIPISDAWLIESEYTIAGEAVTIPLSIVHYGPEVCGEITDILNFLSAIVQYPEFKNFVS